MFKVKAYGFLVIAILLAQECHAEDQVFSLEPIVVSKEKVHLSPAYTVNYDNAGNIALDSPVESLSVTPLDLQSRSLKEGIQSDFSLRGSNFQGVLMLLGGQRINDPQTGHYNADIPFTGEDLGKIEVIPGAGSSVFGPDAIGGAVNFTLKKPRGRKVVLQGKGGQHRSSSELFSISEKKDALGVRLSIENAQSAGFHTDTDFKTFTSSFKSTLELPDAEFDLDFGYQNKEYGAFDFYTPGLNYQSREWTRTFLLNTGFNLQKSGFTIKPNFLWRRHYDKFTLDRTQLRSTYVNHHRTDILTPNIYLKKDMAGLGAVGFGIEYGSEIINSTNLGKHDRAHKSLILDDSKDLTGNLCLGLSLRLDDYDSFDDAYTGSVGLKYEITTRSSLNLGISRSIRIPSFTELYYSDPTTVGDAGLSPEKSINYQLGYEYKKSGFLYGTTFFFRQEKDFIDWVKHSSSQAKWQVENITRDEVFGVENSLKADLNKIISLNAYYTYTNKEIEGEGLAYKYGPNYSRHMLGALFIFNLPFGAQEIGFTYKKKPGRGGWFLINSRLTYRINKNSLFFLEADNLTDTKYEEIIGIPQPGRWIEGGMRLEW